MKIAVTGIALALVAMIVAVSIMLGFKKEIREKIIAFDSELTLVPMDPQEPIYNYPEVIQSIKEWLPDGAEAYAVARQPVVLKTDSAFSGQIMKGVATAEAAHGIAGNMVRGRIPDFAADSARNQILISGKTATKLGIDVGDRPFAFFQTPIGVKTRRVTVTGVFDTHFGDYDRLMCLGSLALLQDVAGADSLTCSTIEIAGVGSDADIDTLALYGPDILMDDYKAGKINAPYSLGNVHISAAAYFNWLSLLDTNITVLIILLGIVSAFTLISSLFIIILERVNMIGLLKALGQTNGSISRIFVLVAQRLVLKGLIIGDVIGLGLVWLQQQFQLIPMDAESYYLDAVPIEISWPWIIALNAGVVVMAWLVLIVPARIVSTISPARAMRWD